MDQSKLHISLTELELKGELYTDQKMRVLYATDASAYRELPKAIVRPKSVDDIKKLIAFASENGQSLIPRTAGTSLAGQVVGNGIVVDVSKHFTQIIELNEKEKWVRVQPGVVLDELNLFLKDHGLFFAPETSTSNRCMLGGMVGNNSCGAHSLIYGSTRDHIKSIKCLLSDGSEAEFTNLNPDEFEQKCRQTNLEGELYRHIQKVLQDAANQEMIEKEYPDKALKRRNTGYALDLLLDASVFGKSDQPFNFSKLIAGSEGTLCFITEICLHLLPLPPKDKVLLCTHHKSLKDAFEANITALKFNPGAVEMMDDVIIACTERNIEQAKNRFFIKGKPKAMLLIEFARSSKEELDRLCTELENKLKEQQLAYDFSRVYANDISRVWKLRKAGLGLLSNIPGDAKPVPVIEDTAVLPEKLPAYMADFRQMLDSYNKSCVYYAHIGSGELHLRPVLNLKDEGDVQLFHDIAYDTALLVKKYNGSLSGEHGDGRLRGEFIPLMLGEHNYKLFKELKAVWDPKEIFNPGKITETPPMNSSLRYTAGQPEKKIETEFDYDADQGFMRAVERCNGSGDCRKSALIGGTMCPSYQATKNEQNTTRARANILREFITQSPKENPFDHQEIYEVMDLCLSCKACKSECPSSVDVAKLKAEFLQHYYDANGIPLRTRIIANIATINSLASHFSKIYNYVVKSQRLRPFVAGLIGFHKKRSLPVIDKANFKKYIARLNKGSDSGKKVYLFSDEFTRYNDAHIGIRAIMLLHKLGYEVVIPKHVISGRSYISKGLLRKAKKLAIQNVLLLEGVIHAKMPLIGIEPSAILTFRDEYPDLLKGGLKQKAINLAENVYTIEEFLAREMDAGKIEKTSFETDAKNILLHGHCQQKALSGTDATKKILSFPQNYEVSEIPSGCCGMAGSFGYEKEHYELSMQVGELVLFPAVRKASDSVLIAAPGTSCRHQIKDGTGRSALHPVEILYHALKK